MVKLSIVLVSLLFPIAAGAQSPPSKAERDAYRAKQMKLIHRAYELQPRRRDTPLRELNISDNEVREIQVVAAKHIPKVLLNISPVVTGCPCEEGPQCTEQVYIVAEKGQTSVGLQLSRVRKAWQVGVVQEWWLNFDALKANRTKLTYDDYAARMDELYRVFPMCVGNLVPAENTTAAVPKVESGK
ncbi:MAG TPA: hypothetical protein VIV63_02970 [Steroidobacteraceae bacterium]